jgi:hypothetical protein
LIADKDVEIRALRKKLKELTEARLGNSMDVTTAAGAKASTESAMITAMSTVKNKIMNEDGVAKKQNTNKKSMTKQGSTKKGGGKSKTAIPKEIVIVDDNNASVNPMDDPEDDEDFDVIDFVWETDEYKKGLFQVLWVAGEDKGKMEYIPMGPVLFDRGYDAFKVIWDKYYMNKSGREVRAVEKVARGKWKGKWVFEGFTTLEAYGTWRQWPAKCQSHRVDGGAKCLRIVTAKKKKHKATHITQVDSIQHEAVTTNDNTEQGDVTLEQVNMEQVNMEQVTMVVTKENCYMEVVTGVSVSSMNNIRTEGTISIHDVTPTKPKKPKNTVVTTPVHPCAVGDHYFDICDQRSWVEQNLLRGLCLGGSLCGKHFVASVKDDKLEYQPTIKTPAHRCTICKRGMCNDCWTTLQQQICKTTRRGKVARV